MKKLSLPLEFNEPFGWQATGRGVLRISSDGDYRKSFLGLKFSIPGFF